MSRKTKATGPAQGGTENSDTLRSEAEKKLAKRFSDTPAIHGSTPDKLVHELQVHQIELEMQNEALRESRSALELSRDEYLDLYDLARAGYLTLTNKAVIEKANLTAATLLGVGRHDLIKNRFRKFVAPRDLEVWERYFLSVLCSAEKQTCTLQLLKNDKSPIPVRVESRRIGREREDPAIRMMISDITAEKRADERLKIFQTFTENARDIVLFIRKSDGKIIEANQKASEIYGFSRDELLKMTVYSLRACDTRALVERQMLDADATGILFETFHRKKNGSDLPVEVNSFSQMLDGEPVLFSIIRDITERKRAEDFRQLSVDVLGILNEPAELYEMARRVLDAIKLTTNADAVGIRLMSGDDFPYFAGNGFSGDFLLKENTLIMHGPDDGICRDSDGNVSLDCMCGLVISGKTDPGNPLFTQGGSFWTNDSFPLLKLTGEDDPRLHPRNTCIHSGYGSVAIIPIRKNPQQIIGTLQINALRKNCFKPDIIQSLELVAGQIGEALMRKQAEEEVRESEAKYRTLFEHMTEGLAYCRMVFNNEGRPEDFVYLTVNPAFGRILGIPQVIGKPVTKVFPGIRESFPELFEIYGRVALTGVPESFDLDFVPLKKWLHISVYSPAREHFMAIFEDITERKRAEEALIRKSDNVQAVNEELVVAGDELRMNEARLTESLEEKEALLSEVHHRVKNNLSAFISLLSLDGTYEESKEGQRLKKDLQNRARSMALIHETLYKTREFSNVDMGVYLSTLTEQIAGTYQSVRSIRTIVHADGIRLDLARATPCGLIINELITNVFKYAFPASFDCEAVRHEPCTLRISLTSSQGHYLLSVRDNGIGLSETFDPATAKSLGLKLVTFLARHQLRAKVETSRKNGTEFTIRFKE